MRFVTILLILSSLLGLTQCIPYDFSRRIVQQGNLLPQAKIERLRVGMSKEDVGILMGNSLLSPTFNNNKWDYVYTWRKGSSKPIIRNLTLYFTNNRLTRIEHHP